MLRVLIYVTVLVFMNGCAIIKELHTEESAKKSWGKMCYPSFQKHVRNLSGKGVVNCGFFSNLSNNDKKQYVQNCAEKVVNSGKPYIFGHRAQGDDSIFCDVAIRDIDGNLWSFFYDSDISGGSGGPSALWISECKSIAMQPGTIAQDSFFDLQNCTERTDIRNKVFGE